MTRAPVDPWFKFFPRDWLEGTRMLTLEQRGAYIDAIAMQMINGGPLPADYAWLGHQMHVSSRKAQAIVEGPPTGSPTTGARRRSGLGNISAKPTLK